ncbi:hypothetical protein Tco_1235001 [Tanacetum coccineum]
MAHSKINTLRFAVQDFLSNEKHDWLLNFNEWYRSLRIVLSDSGLLMLLYKALSWTTRCDTATEAEKADSKEEI